MKRKPFRSLRRTAAASRDFSATRPTWTLLNSDDLVTVAVSVTVHRSYQIGGTDARVG